MNEEKFKAGKMVIKSLTFLNEKKKKTQPYMIGEKKKRYWLRVLPH